MRLAIVLLLVVAFLGGTAIAVARSPQHNPLMPHVWDMEVLDRGSFSCEDGTVLVRFVFAQDNEDDMVVYAYFLIDDFNNNPRARPRPFAVLWYINNEYAYIRTDLNRNGIVDSRGRIGDPGIGHGACDTFVGRRG